MTATLPKSNFVMHVIHIIIHQCYKTVYVNHRGVNVYIHTDVINKNRFVHGDKLYSSLFHVNHIKCANI